jgi:hypothetical protein
MPPETRPKFKLRKVNGPGNRFQYTLVKENNEE